MYLRYAFSLGGVKKEESEAALIFTTGGFDI